MNPRRMLLLWLIILPAAPVSRLAAAELIDGEVKLGYVATHVDGDRSLLQSSYNAHEGVVLSLEDFGWRSARGTRVSADLRNIGLGNQRWNARIVRPGGFGLTMAHSRYRRIYSDDGSHATLRRLGSSSLWVEPFAGLRLFGGLGLESRKGTARDHYDPGVPAITSFNTDRRYGNAGIRWSRKAGHFEAEYRASTSRDDAGGSAGTDGRRFRFLASSRIPGVSRATLYGGFQRHEWENADNAQDLTANTVWGGGRIDLTRGLALRHDFSIDRARFSSDPVATDNVRFTTTLERRWPGTARLAAGYTFRGSDNLAAEKLSHAYSASVWARVSSRIEFAAAYRATREDLDEGTTLTGEGDFTRYSGSVTFRGGARRLALKVDSRSTSRRTSGYTGDVIRLGAETSLANRRVGDLVLSYAYDRGNYRNGDSPVLVADHSVGWEGTSVHVGRFQASARGNYYRSRRNLNVEIAGLELTTRYRLMGALSAEMTYRRGSFDDLLLATETYTRYATLQTVEVKLVRSL